MAKKNFDSTDYLKHMNYAWPVCGLASMSNNTVSHAVALATIEATDIVVASILNQGATAAYIVETVVTAGTGFTVTLNLAAIATTVAYAVFKNNS